MPEILARDPLQFSSPGSAVFEEFENSAPNSDARIGPSYAPRSPVVKPLSLLRGPFLRVILLH